MNVRDFLTGFCFVMFLFSFLVAEVSFIASVIMVIVFGTLALLLSEGVI